MSKKDVTPRRALPRAGAPPAAPRVPLAARPPLADTRFPLTTTEVSALLRQAAQQLHAETAHRAAASLETTLSTLGHSTHPVSHVLALLTQHGITAVADVRSMPSSRRSPQWNRESLRAALASHPIASVHVGELGARPNDPSCYVEGRVAYARLAVTAAFQQSLARLHRGLQRYRIALLCAESDPLACHRTILICHALRVPARTIQHILADGRLEAHAASEQRLIHRVGEVEDDPQALERAYAFQGHRLACTMSSPHCRQEAPCTTTI